MFIAATTQPVNSNTIDFNNNTTFTIGSIFVIAALLTLIGSGIQRIINMTKEAEEKRGIEKTDKAKTDLIVTMKLDALSNKIDTGFARVDGELLRLERRLSISQAKTNDLEMFLGTKHGYVSRRYNDDDSM